jgi:ATP-binding protein involved in chromosome partitioning
MSDTLTGRVDEALLRIRHPRTGTDLLASESVRDVATTTSGKVRLTLLLAPGDDPALALAIRRAVEAVDGVTHVQVDVKEAPPLAPPVASPPEPQRKAPGAAGGGSRALPVMDQPAAPARAAAPTPVPLPNLGRIIAVSSGKGGVGKSTVAVNLAIALVKAGKRVGLMDADVYGPNLPRMMGLNEPPAVINERIIPLQAHGVKFMSIGVLIDRDQPAIWRGPIIMKIIGQFLRDVAWGELDYFIVDMPPGTGDAQLSLVQSTNLAGAIIVTTPQEVSVGDALRGAKMFQRVNVPVLGIVENMSWFECPHCGKPTALFGTGGGERLAKELELPLLAQIPLVPQVREGGDAGAPIVVSDPTSSAARALAQIADRVAAHFAS